MLFKLTIITKIMFHTTRIILILNEFKHTTREILRVPFQLLKMFSQRHIFVYLINLILFIVTKRMFMIPAAVPNPSTGNIVCRWWSPQKCLFSSSPSWLHCIKSASIIVPKDMHRLLEWQHILMLNWSHLASVSNETRHLQFVLVTLKGVSPNTCASLPLTITRSQFKWRKKPTTIYKCIFIRTQLSCNINHFWLSLLMPFRLY